MERKIKRVKLEYPRLDGNYNAIDIGLVDVRASDGILVEYDFERDGWAIYQPTRLSWELDEIPDPHYKEVAFIQSWAVNEDEDYD